MRRAAALLAASALAATAAAVVMPTLGGAHPLAAAPRCSLFPADNPWNQRVDRLPVARGSAAIIAAIGVSARVHPDFGAAYWDGAPNGIPITMVDRRTRRVRVRFTYAEESDPGPYPIPRHPLIEGGPRSSGDRHILLLDRDSCRDYELYAAYPANGGRAWRGRAGRIVCHLRPALEPPAPRRLDVRRRRRAADPPRPRSL